MSRSNIESPVITAISKALFNLDVELQSAEHESAQMSSLNLIL